MAVGLTASSCAASEGDQAVLNDAVAPFPLLPLLLLSCSNVMKSPTVQVTSAGWYCTICRESGAQMIADLLLAIQSHLWMHFISLYVDLTTKG